MKEYRRQPKGAWPLSSSYPSCDDEIYGCPTSTVTSASAEVRADLSSPVLPPGNGVGGQWRSDDLSNLLRTAPSASSTRTAPAASSTTSPSPMRSARLYPSIGMIHSVPQEITWDSTTYASPSLEGGKQTHITPGHGPTSTAKPLPETAPFVPSKSTQEFRLNGASPVPAEGKHAHPSKAVSDASAIHATKSKSGATPPLFGTRASKTNPLEDDLPENLRKLQEQHSVCLSGKTNNSYDEKPPMSSFRTQTPATATPSPSATAESAAASSNSLSMLKPPVSAPSQAKPQVSFAALPAARESMVESAASMDSKPAAAAFISTTHKMNGLSAQSSTTTLTPMEIEEARDYARTLQKLCEKASAADMVDVEDVEFVLTMFTMCTSASERVNRAIQEALAGGGLHVDGSVQDLFQLNENLTHSIGMGEKLLRRTASSVKTPDESPGFETKVEFLSPPTMSPPSHPDSGNPQQEESMENSASNLNVQVLVEKKDIFSLICMLRAQHTERRLEAAYALMEFARDESLHLRHEIRSSGGLHSLLTLFRTPGTPYETKVVLALAVAFLLEEVEKIPARLGLKVVDCLRLLSRARKITPNGHPITEEECVRAAAKGVLVFWMNQLLPMLDSDKRGKESHEEKSVDESIMPLHRTSSGAARLRTSRISTAGGGLFDQRRESIEIQELLEMTLSLIVYMAEPQKDRPTLYEAYALVEEVCAVEVARPIAVREGILRTLVSWIRSKDPVKIRSAANSLRHLTSIKDSYMAGWIHSQMVTEGALEVIVNLMHDGEVGHDVQLAVAHILSSLCVAPHTRAAVAEANGIALLIQFLAEYKCSPSQEGALFAGRALLQLASGAITRASVFGDETYDADTDYVSSSKRDDVVKMINEHGAIEAFVEIAQSDKGKLRSMAVEALRVLSEDVSSSRQTRAQLCFHGAAKALGVALKENVEANGEVMSSNIAHFTDRTALKELHEALCALANILDPLPEGSPIGRQRQISDGLSTRKLLINGCIQTTDSGGLEALLFIASIPFLPADGSNLDSSHFQMMGLLEEACRSLASMSPLLLNKSVAKCGYSKWTDDILKALYKVTKQLQTTARVVEAIRDSVTEVEVNVLRGIGALAQSEPLKIRIIDRFLPFLLAMNVVRDGTDTSNAANQAFQSLGFTDDEVAVQVAGNNPQLLADWFCLKRSCLIQAMARDEIRALVQDMWYLPFKETSNNLCITRLMPEASDFSRSDDSGSVCADLFENFATDADTYQLMLGEYRDIYGIGAKPSSLLEKVSGELGDDVDNECLLSRQSYPLNSSEDETEWILAHDRAAQKFDMPPFDMPSRCLSRHVEMLLDHVFPSRLIRNQVLPVYSLRPHASFNFRGLMMPQRRYFSFRREGQLLSRLCATEAAALDSVDVHWTLGFTNSSFAGEFSESLVQALYMCPMVLGLSFSNMPDVGDDSSDKECKDDEGGAIIANLVGSLPPWISSLTFDGLLSDRDMKSLVAILETMGKLSVGHDSQLDRKPASTTCKDGSRSCAQGQGRFCFFAVRRSAPIQRDSWNSFFHLLGACDSASQRFSKFPLSSLKILDLSGNQLGDDLCATVLRLAHDSNSGCLLEQLDLSGNRIRAGTNVLKVLKGYVEYYRYSHQVGRKTSEKGWKSPLHTLILANNGLHMGGKACIEFIALLKHNALELQVLDLSANGLVRCDYEVEFCDVLVSALLKNSCLQRLNLSNNMFSRGAVDSILDGLAAATHDSVLAFMQFDDNSPSLSGQQQEVLASICSQSRKVLLQRFMVEQEKSRDNEPSDGEEFSSATKLPSSLQMDEFSIPENEETSATLYRPLERPSMLSPSATGGDNMITVLFSAPLVFHDEHRILRPFAKLDFRLERELMWQSLKEASRDIQLFFDNATTDRFLAAISKRCSCLHYSGHGHQEFLPFEDRGGPQWLGTKEIRDLIATKGGASFRFVFVSACHSYNVGQTFATAGVPHVVCCEEESELKDNAALAFTRNFYLALAVGNTVKESFDQGCKAVRATPNLRNAEKEMRKFRLLPEDGDHNLPIFVNAKPVVEWPRSFSDKIVSSKNLRKSTRQLRKSIYSGETSTMELSVRNMIQEDPSPSPPQFFLGREVDMYLVLRQILEQRLVSVVGEAGVGRSSLICALCHYINERASTMIEIERIYFVKAEKGGRLKQSVALMQRLLKRLKDAEKLHELPTSDADIETMTDIACKVLRNDKALIVFDRVDLLDDADEASEFPIALKNLLSETRNLKVVLSNRRPLGIPSIGEKSFELGPLNLGNTIRLFAFLCPFVHTPKERQKLFKALIADLSQESLLPTDPGLSPTTIELFSVLGSGIPSRIEKAAYNCSKDLYMSLMTGSFLDSAVAPVQVQET